MKKSFINSGSGQEIIKKFMLNSPEHEIHSAHGLNVCC